MSSRTVTTTREFDESGNLVKEIVVEQIIDREVCTRPHVDENPLKPNPCFPKKPNWPWDTYWEGGRAPFGPIINRNEPACINAVGPQLQSVPQGQYFHR